MAEDEDGFLGGLEGGVQLGGQVVGAFFLFLEAAGAEFDQFFQIGAMVHHLGDHGIKGVGQLADFPWAAIARDAGMRVPWLARAMIWWRGMTAIKVQVSPTRVPSGTRR